MSTGPETRRVLGLLAVAASLPVALLAQGSPRPGAVSAYTGFEARGYNFSTGLGLKSVSEFTVPFAVVWTTSDRLAFDLGGRYASATRTGADTSGSVSISGLTDVQLRGVYQLVPDVAVFTVAANLPTGKTKLTSDQLLVAGTIASDLLPYPVANFGSGFNLTGGLAVAVPVSGWALGFAGSYRVNSTFTPIAPATDSSGLSYKAGGEFRLRVGADRIVGQSRVSLGFTYSTFGEDQYASSPIFQAGARYITQASWSFPVGNVGLSVYAWDLYRSSGSQLFVGSSAATQKRNVLTLGVEGSIQLGAGVLRPLVEFRSHALGTSSLAGAGKLFSAGVRYRMPLGERFTLLPALRFDGGSENVLGGDGNPTGQTVSLTGWSVGVTVRAAM
jgi:hypothetical protein